MGRALFFVEDPGAALFMQALPRAVAASGHDQMVGAIGHAMPYFPDAVPVPEAVAGDGAAADALLDRLAPSVLITGTSENLDSFAFPLIQAAKRRGLPTVGAVDSAANADCRFRGRTADPLAYIPDQLLVPDRATADAFTSLGIGKSDIHVCGHPRIEEVAAIRARWNAADRRVHRARWFGDVPNDRKIIVFVSELSTGLGTDLFVRNPHYLLTGNRGSTSRTDIVAEELVLAARQLRFAPHLVLRLHPKQRLQDEVRCATLFDQVSHGEPGLEIVHAADLVVGMTSILLTEAAALGRPVLSVVPVPEEQVWLGDAGAHIPSVSTRTDISRWLARGKSHGWPAPSKASQSSADTVIMDVLLPFLRRVE